MFNFLKKDGTISVEHFMNEMPGPAMSEGIIKRDNYFHSCWMLLKKQRPDLWEEMTKVEMSLAGYDPDEQKEDPEKKKKKGPEGIVM